MIGGIAQSVPTAIAGGVGASGAGLYSDRYRLQVQAANYELAADSMLCMYLASEKISIGNRIGEFAIDGLPAKDVVREIALNGLLRVRDKLHRLQSAFDLGKPDPQKLKEALTAEPQTSTTANKALLQTDEGKTLKRDIGEYKNTIAQCVAQITG